jgi:hypothetical protein
VSHNTELSNTETEPHLAFPLAIAHHVFLVATGMYYAHALTSELSAKQYSSSTIRAHLASPLEKKKGK